MSRLMADLCRLLQVRQIKTTLYHPQTDGLVERFNQTLKQMLRRVAADDRQDWDKMLPYVLFGIREVPQASTGFTPFEPTTKTQVRAFLGLAGYYLCFIPNFSSLASPLTDLTRKGQPETYPGVPKRRRASNGKTALTSEPILRAPDFSCPFLVQTDASDTELGAVLSQVQEGEEHPVVYISRKLSPAEQRYAAVEKEALAVKWASWSSGTTSSAVNSPSSLTMPLYSGWPWRRTPTRG